MDTLHSGRLRHNRPPLPTHEHSFSSLRTHRRDAWRQSCLARRACTGRQCLPRRRPGAQHLRQWRQDRHLRRQPGLADRAARRDDIRLRRQPARLAPKQFLSRRRPQFRHFGRVRLIVGRHLAAVRGWPLADDHGLWRQCRELQLGDREREERLWHPGARPDLERQGRHVARRVARRGGSRRARRAPRDPRASPSTARACPPLRPRRRCWRGWPTTSR
jgi:hypothetical protein